MSRYVEVRADRAKIRIVRSAPALTCLVFVSLGIGSCTADMGVTVDVEETPEGRWETLDPVAAMATASSGGSPVVGRVMSEPVTIRVTDKRGRPFAGLTVTWTVSDPSAGTAETDNGTFVATLATLLDAQGQSSVFWRAGTVAGDQSITATVAGPGKGKSKRVTTDFDATVDPGAPAQLAVSPDQAEMEIDGGQHLIADVMDEYGNDVDNVAVQWASTDETVATVDTTGMVTPRDLGVAVISASVASFEDGATIQVVQGSSGTPALGSLVISPRTLSRPAGQTYQLSINATDSLGSPISPLVAWASRDLSVATVSGTGLVTTIADGIAFITATSACCALDSVQVVVEEGSSAEDLDWFCDWDFATGDAFNAIRGTNSSGAGLSECFGGFTASATDTFLVVQPKTPAQGFPSEMPNVLRMEFDRNKFGSMMVQIDSGWTRPDVGSYVYYRTYDFNDMAVGTRVNTHLVHVGTNARGGSDYALRWFQAGSTVAADSTYDMSFSPLFNRSNEGLGQGEFRNYGGQKVGQLYRKEWRIHRTDVDSLRFQVRMYNAAGAIVSTGSDYVCAASESGGCMTNGFQQDTLGEHKVHLADMHWLEGLEFGNNGSEGGDPNGPEFWYFGGVAVRVSSSPDAWIGAYPVGPEGND